MVDTRSYRWNKGHKTVWPNQETHSSERRPGIYRGAKTWWVDDSGTNPNAWDDDWEQSGFGTWEEALEYALDEVRKFGERNGN